MPPRGLTGKRLSVTPRHGLGAALDLALGNIAMSRVSDGFRHRHTFLMVALAAWAGQALFALWPAVLPADPVFSPEATVTCVQAVEAGSPGLSVHAVLDCVGRAAQACMTMPGGDTTIGMIDCLVAENAYWDARLNAAYTARMAESRQADEENARLGSADASLGDALRAMQSTSIGYRDATCLHEQAQWRGGSGGDPATRRRWPATWSRLPATR